jgi:hypothetical protein
MSWVENEMKSSHMTDKRLETRLSCILERLSENPQLSIPASCQGWNETHAAYRFIDHDKVDIDQILQGHKAASIERINKQKCVLLAQDTTFLDYGQEEEVGLGTLRSTKSDFYLLHATVAFNAARVNLGVVNAKLWQRPDQPVAHVIDKMPIEEKERWLAKSNANVRIP